MDSLIERVSRRDPDCTEAAIVVEFSIDDILGDDDATRYPDERLIWLVEALKGNPHVRSIDFSYARCSPELFRQLAALFGLNAVIRRATLPNRTRNEDLLLIAQSLRRNTTVTSLALRFENEIQGREGGEIMGTLLLNNGTITELDLGFSHSLGANGAEGIAPALRNDRCALKRLNLSQCRIGNCGARELSNALGSNTVLEELRIAFNAITFTGCRHVFEMLDTNAYLRVLYLEGNSLNQHMTGHETVGDLVLRALRRNTLQALNLNGCGLDAGDVSRIVLTLAGDNQTLSRLGIRNNEMDEASMNNLAWLLPKTKRLEVLEFSWDKLVASVVLRGFLEGLRNNRSLFSVHTFDDSPLQGEGSGALWDTWSAFVTRRNRMHPLLERNDEASGGGRRVARPAQPVPASLWPPVLNWCSSDGQNVSMQEAEAFLIDKFSDEQNGSMEEVKASLIHHVLCTRADDIFDLVTTTSKRPALEV